MQNNHSESNLDLKQIILDVVKNEQRRPIPAGIVVKKIITKHPNINKPSIYSKIDYLISDGSLRHDMRGKIILGYEDAPKDMSSIKVGTLSITSNGDGFIQSTLEDGSTISYYVNKKHLQGGLKGDTVEFVKLLKEPKNGVYDASILNILERNKTYFVGEIQIFADGKYDIKLDDCKVYQNVRLDSIDNLLDGYKILIQVAKFSEKEIYGKAVKVIGHKNDVGSDILSVIIENSIPYETNEEITQIANAIKFKIDDKDLKLRKDITNRPIVSIDPITSKDLDDAIYVKKLADGNFLLGVSIADVSYYVNLDSNLDKEAFNKGTSVYLVDRVIPMLPHNLSNNICSLNPNQKRMALTCDMVIDKHGNFKSIDLYPSIIQSQVKFGYEQVNEYYETKERVVQTSDEVYQVLDDAKQLHHVLRNKKRHDGYVDFEINEPYIVLDKTGFPVDIKIKLRGTAQKMIEDFMIAANEAVTVQAEKWDLPFIFRVHEKPDEKRIKSFLVEAKKMMFKINIKDDQELEPRDIAKWIDDNQESPKFQLLSKLLLRAMQKANYSTNNIGHFGLASKNYTHFTSPIRRYSDLIVHRIFWMFVFDKNSYSDAQRQKLMNELNDICEQCNETEIRAVKVERDVNALKFAEYMTKHLGEEYDAIASTITSFGIFVELQNTIEGLVSIKNMNDDFYTYDDQQMILIGKKFHKIFTLGTPLKVKAIGANKLERKIDFEIIE